MPATETNRGSSHWTPNIIVKTAKPRLFYSERSARMAAQSWARGEYEWMYRPSHDDGGECVQKPRPGRRAEDVEVIRLEATAV